MEEKRLRYKIIKNRLPQLKEIIDEFSSKDADTAEFEAAVFVVNAMYIDTVFLVEQLEPLLGEEDAGED